MFNKKVEGYSTPIRLDRYLRAINSCATQGLIEKYLRQSIIKVNHKKAASNLRIKDGDIISLPEGFEDKTENIVHTSSAKALADKLMSEYLLYNHKHFYAFYKPPGLSAQGGSKISVSLDDAFRVLGLRLVHRIDKDTSGIILAAKNRDDATTLTTAFAEHQIKKTYFACVSPIPKKKRGQIVSYLVKKDQFTVESYDEQVEGSREAITEYQVVATEDNIALVKFNPITGRMHQLRVHAKELGSPIVGDKKYGGKIASYLMLHAHQIILDHTIFNEKLVIKADIPPYFVIKSNNSVQA